MERGDLKSRGLDRIAEVACVDREEHQAKHWGLGI